MQLTSTTRDIMSTLSDRAGGVEDALEDKRSKPTSAVSYFLFSLSAQTVRFEITYHVPFFFDFMACEDDAEGEMKWLV